MAKVPGRIDITQALALAISQHRQKQQNQQKSTTMNKSEFVEFVESTKPEYASADGIKIIKTLGYWGDPKSSYSHYIRMNHVGWKCPGMYKDSPPDENSARIKNEWEGYGNGLFLVCESDDYAEIPYLTLQVVDRDTLRLVDEYNGCKPEQEMVFKRYIPAVPATTATADDSETPQ